MKKTIRLGTRGSPLALIQAAYVRAKLLAAHEFLHTESEIEIVAIRTGGDWRPGHDERSFLETGGDKGLFVKEIEEALLAGHIDMAVHSMKDMPSQLPPRLEIACVPARADPHDVLIANNAQSLDELPEGAVIGTASLRRKAQILKYRPDLRVVPLRGNVDTRLAKIADGEADATVLALAGLQRLGVEDRIAAILETDIMLPAAGQGALAIEIRRDDEDMHRLLAPLNCAATATCIAAERALILALDGSCHTPIGALAQLDENNELALEGLVARPDGSEIIRMSSSGAAAAAEALGRALGEDLKRRMPKDFFTSPSA